MTVEKYALTDDYQISRVINGGWQLSSGHALQNELDMDNAYHAFARLLDEGFNTFDCADIYTGVEEFIGKLVASRKADIGHDDIQVHTKFVPDMDALAQVDEQYVERIITRSLKRLNKERLDLVQFHWWDYAVPGFVEAAGYLVRLQEKGLIRHIATTNFDTPHLKLLLDAGIPVVSNQIQYSVLDRRPEKQMVQLCQQTGVKLICYGSLAGGFLAEKWLGQKRPERFENRSLVKYDLVIEDAMGWDAYQELLQQLNQFAQKYHCSIANIAARYVLQKNSVAAVIIGTRSARHIESNKKVFSFALSDTEINTINQYLNHFSGLDGEPFELERLAGCKHREIMKMNLADI